MLIAVGISCRICCSVVSYLHESFNGFITVTVGEERAIFVLLSITRIYIVSVGVLFNCGSPWAFHIIIVRL